MTIDVTNFHKVNVVDTCAVWNILSSRILFHAAITAGCIFSCTGFVFYECLLKQRRHSSVTDDQLQELFHKEILNKRMQIYHLDAEDLQEINVLENRKKLGKGELSSIAFAKKTQQAVLTDDQGARKLAASVMDFKKVQTTPHLTGWLFYSGFLVDQDKKTIIEEHDSFNLQLGKYFESAYTLAMEASLMNRFP